MNVQVNVDQSMALPEDVVWIEAAQRVKDLGFHSNYITEAMSRIVAVSDITESSTIEEIDLIKEERNLSEEEIKRPSPDTKKNTARDPENLRRENQKLRRMMRCKSCKISNATCVNMNIECRHLFCSNCCDVLTACRKCRAMITTTVPVKFANE